MAQDRLWGTQFAPERAHTTGERCGSLYSRIGETGVWLRNYSHLEDLVSYGGRIALLPGQAGAEEFTTLVRETAHKLRPGHTREELNHMLNLPQSIRNLDHPSSPRTIIS
jgi:hypothetical protein